MKDFDFQIEFTGFNEGLSPVAHLDSKTFVGNKGQASEMLADVITNPGFIQQSPALSDLVNGNQNGVVDELVRFILDTPVESGVTYAVGTSKLFRLSPDTVDDGTRFSSPSASVSPSASPSESPSASPSQSPSASTSPSVSVSPSISPSSPATITLDSTSNGAVTSTSLTISHTIGNNSNRGLYLGISTLQTISSVTYGGNAMTLLDQQSLSNSHAYFYYMLAPAVGTADIVITVSSSGSINADAVSFYGVDQATPTPIAKSTASVTTSCANTLTTPVDNAVHLVAFSVDSSAITSVTNGTLISQVFSYSNPLLVTSAGSHTMTGNSGSNNTWSTVGAAISPATTNPSSSPSASPTQSPSQSVSPSASTSPSVSKSPSASPSTSPSVSTSPSISASISPSVLPNWPQTISGMLEGESVIRLKTNLYVFYNKVNSGDIARMPLNTETIDATWGSVTDLPLEKALHPVDVKEDIMVFGNGRYVGVYIEGQAILDTQKLDFGEGAEVADIVFNANVWWIAVNYGEGKRSEIYLYDGSAISNILSDEAGVGDQKIGFLYIKDGLLYIAYDDNSSEGFSIGWLQGRQIKPLRYFSGTLPDHRQKALYKNTIIFVSDNDIWSCGAPVDQLPIQISRLSDGGYSTVGAIASPFGVPMITSTDGDGHYRFAKYNGYSTNSDHKSVFVDITQGRSLGKVQTIIVSTKELVGNARCDLKLEGNQGKIESSSFEISGVGDTRHVFRSIDLAACEDIRVVLDYEHGDSTNTCPIRKVTVLGNFLEQ